MTRDVLISISGIQIAEGDNNTVELITSGDYFLKNGNHYILYDEIQEGFEGVIKNTIKISPSGLDIIKRGSSSVHMTFEKSKKNILYREKKIQDFLTIILHLFYFGVENNFL